MREQFGLVVSEHCYLRQAGQNDSGIEDEIFSGWAVRIFPETQENGWIRVETHYGYQGYVGMECLRLIGQEELRERQDRRSFWRIGVGEADLLQIPKVQGLPLELLLKNAFVELLTYEEAEGWSRIRTAAGREGFVHTKYLCERKDDDGYLLGKKDFLKTVAADEESFREGLVQSARSYLGTQYRWGGKSSQGIDCSGLAFMSYMENGVLIYRDAKIMDDYPVRAVSAAEIKKGDLIFFPGHVAMYLGDDRYIHSTATAGSPCVTINSLNPADADYRPDLPEKITGYGSIFASTAKTASAGKPGNEAGAECIFRTDQVTDTGSGTGDKPVCGEYWESLRGRLERLPGNISFVYQNLTTGERVSYCEEHPHLAASIIKLFLMAAVFDGIDKGKYRPDDLIEVRRSDCVPSCGVITYLPEERKLSVRDLLELMIIVSDNTAANLLFDLVGRADLAVFIRETLGMEKTVFRRKMFDAESAAQGIENYVTAKDAAELLEKIYRGELVSPKASEEMYQILTHQRLNGKIPFRLHTLKPQPVIAHKTGEDGGITHDVGIIEGKHPFILCFLGSSTDVPEYERLMADAAWEIYGRIK